MVETFAAVQVHVKITKIENLEKGIYVGVLTRKHDLKVLKNAGVPYQLDENPLECESVVYDFQVVKEVRHKRKRNAKRIKRSTS